MQAVDLVDEEDVPLLQIGQDAREIAGALDLRTTGGMEFRAHRGGDDVGQRRLAESRRTAEQHMVERVAALLRGLDHQHEPLLDALLTGEFTEVRRTQRHIERGVRCSGGLVVEILAQGA